MIRIINGNIVPENQDDIELALTLCKRFTEIALPADTFRHEAIADSFFYNKECMMIRRLEDGSSVVSILRRKEEQT